MISVIKKKRFLKSFKNVYFKKREKNMICVNIPLMYLYIQHTMGNYINWCCKRIRSITGLQSFPLLFHEQKIKNNHHRHQVQSTFLIHILNKFIFLSSMFTI